MHFEYFDFYFDYFDFYFDLFDLLFDLFDLCLDYLIYILIYILIYLQIIKWQTSGWAGRLKCSHFLMIFVVLWLKPWTPPPPLPPYHLCLLFPDPAFLSVLCTAFSLWYVQFLVCVMCGFLVCLVPSFRYTTARFRELSLASLASARSARCSSLRSLQRVWPDPRPSPPLSQRTKNDYYSLREGWRIRPINNVLKGGR